MSAIDVPEVISRYFALDANRAIDPIVLCSATTRHISG